MDMSANLNQVQSILCLLKASGADGWELTDTVTEGWEYYLIRGRLDQNRVRLTEHIRVKLYQKNEDGTLLGSVEGEIPPTAAEEEAARLIRRYLAQASYVRNPVYTLNPPSDASDMAQTELPDPGAIAADFLNALSCVRETPETDLNSVEIFVNACTRRYVNSRGVDVTSRYPSSMLEAVINARREGHEIELYRMFTSGTCDPEALRGDLEEAFRFGRDRLRTGPTPKLGSCDLLLSTDAAEQVYSWFISRMGAATIYQGLSDWKPGTDVMPDAQGDRVTVSAVRCLDNSSGNMAYDAEGAPVRDMVLIENGVAKNIWGSRQFAQYLQLDGAFIPRNFAVSGGTSDDLYGGECLEVVEFSDFQVNAMTGDLAGEIRLAYLHRGGETTVVSGGSVSGNMKELCRGMRMSVRQRQYDTMLIPALTRLSGVHIAGVADGESK